MTDGTMVMTMPALALTGLYGGIALLLLSLHLKSTWRWPVKSGAIGLTLPATIGAFLTIEAQLGWPSHGDMLANFQLHAALVNEPARDSSEPGAIFLWLTPWNEIPPGDDADMAAVATPKGQRPRAFDLPYSRELHQEVDSMRERLARGELVLGRHERVDGRQRRFGRQDSQIDLDALPPPPLPVKDG